MATVSDGTPWTARTPACNSFCKRYVSQTVICHKLRIQGAKKKPSIILGLSIHPYELPDSKHAWHLDYFDIKICILRQRQDSQNTQKWFPESM